MLVIFSICSHPCEVGKSCITVIMEGAYSQASISYWIVDLTLPKSELI